MRKDQRCKVAVVLLNLAHPTLLERAIVAPNQIELQAWASIELSSLDGPGVAVEHLQTTTGSYPMSPTEPPSDELIRLDWGWPSLNLNPIEAFRASALTFFTETAKVQAALHYGSFPGADEVRETFAQFLSEHRAASVEPEQLFVTSGAGAAIGLLCDIYAQKGQSVLTQGTTYQNALKIFASRQLNVEAIAEQPSGHMDLAALDDLLRQDRQRFALIYLIPTFANPTGRTLDTATREALVELAQRHEILIIADEVYHPLH
ncbi:MAG: aminotransferase class I/II-fold pyridoxal phosphate-dependent enzyme, partial [Myxococcota bacterium]|nr:aminotransferase class I/II-fold pyridoxal phosphate-dependent enzyme [Myxococcota bacterium]